MATSRKYVKGKLTKELLDMPPEKFVKLTRSELREVVSRLADAANKRLKRLRYPTPASEKVNRGGGKFSTKGKNLNQLRGEYIRVKTFLEDETSTNKGMEKYIREVKEKVKEETGVDMTTEEFFDFWNIYKGLYNDFPALMRDKRFKYETWRIINEALIYDNTEDKTRDEILTGIRERVVSAYEEMKNQNGKSNSVSDYF